MLHFLSFHYFWYHHHIVTHHYTYSRVCGGDVQIEIREARPQFVAEDPSSTRTLNPREGSRLQNTK